jgi:hypothetical protein
MKNITKLSVLFVSGFGFIGTDLHAMNDTVVTGIGGIALSAPIIIAAHAGHKRRSLEQEVAEYKKTLTAEELELFEKEASMTDTWMLTSATGPLVLSASIGAVAKNPVILAGSYSAAVLAAASAEYLERRNAKKFHKFCVNLAKKHEAAAKQQDSAAKN